jgi:hypothetical protein
MVKKKKHSTKTEAQEPPTKHVVQGVNIANIHVDKNKAAAGHTSFEEVGIEGFSRKDVIHDMDEEDISMWKKWFETNNIPIPPDLMTEKNVCFLVQEYKKISTALMIISTAEGPPVDVANATEIVKSVYVSLSLSRHELDGEQVLFVKRITNVDGMHQFTPEEASEIKDTHMRECNLEVLGSTIVFDSLRVQTVALELQLKDAQKEVKRNQIKLQIIQSSTLQASMQRAQDNETIEKLTCQLSKERKNRDVEIIVAASAHTAHTNEIIEKLTCQLSETRENLDTQFIIFKDELSEVKLQVKTKEKALKKMSTKMSGLLDKEQKGAQEIENLKSQLLSLSSDNNKQNTFLEEQRKINTALCEEIRLRDEREIHKKQYDEKRKGSKKKEKSEVLECVFCQEKAPDMLVLPCKHISLCRYCVENHYNNKLHKCPSCMCEVTEVIGPVFLASY